MLSNISEKAHTVSVGWLAELSYTGNLTTFQQLDFTNGKTASVFLQVHIWQSLLLRQAEAGSRCGSAPLQRCRLLGPDNTGLLRRAWAPQAVESACLINICKHRMNSKVQKKWSDAIFRTSLFVFAVANLSRYTSCHILWVWVLKKKKTKTQPVACRGNGIAMLLYMQEGGHILSYFLGENKICRISQQWKLKKENPCWPEMGNILCI